MGRPVTKSELLSAAGENYEKMKEMISSADTPPVRQDTKNGRESLISQCFPPFSHFLYIVLPSGNKRMVSYGEFR